MNSEEIIINDLGVAVLGVSLGLSPKAENVEMAFEKGTIRQIASLRGRQVRMCDSKGLSWLVDLASGVVLWIEIHLAKFDFRPSNEHDPLNYFNGKIRIGQYTVQHAFSLETGERLRNLQFPGLSLTLIPDGRSIRSITIGFIENEKFVFRRN